MTNTATSSPGPSASSLEHGKHRAAQGVYLKGTLYCLAASVSFGLMFPVMASALTRVDPFTFTSLRYLIAAAVSLVLLRITEGPNALDLQGELARRRHDQRQWRAGRLEPLGVAEQIPCHGQSIGNGLARAGLGRNQEVAADGVVGQHGELDGGRLFVVALSQGAGERRTCGRKGHEMGNLDWSGRRTSSGTT